MRSIIVLLGLLLASSAGAQPRDVQLIAFSASGETALVMERTHGFDGDGVASYRVVGPGILQERHVTSHMVSVDGGPVFQRIPAKVCRQALLELQKVLRSARFQGIELRGAECAGDREGLVVATPALAAQAEAAELEAAGEWLVRGDWRVRIEEDELVLESPGASRRLRLPRPVPAEAAHVLLSPSRRLMLLLASTGTGEQVLVAGFSSKSGTVAGFQ